MNAAGLLRARIDPAWMLEQDPNIQTGDKWQKDILRSPGVQIGSAGWTAVLSARRVGKSATVAAWLAHLAFCHPGSTELVVAPTQDQAIEMVRLVRGLLEAAGVPFHREADSRIVLHNGARVLARHAGDSTRGLTPDAVAVDEAGHVADEAFQGVVLPLLALGAPCLAVGTPSASPAEGQWFRKAIEGSEGWTARCVPAEECPRLTAQILASMRAEMTSAQYAREFDLAWAFDSSARVFSDRLLGSAVTGTGCDVAVDLADLAAEVRAGR